MLGWMIWLAAAVRLIFACTATWVQYYIWSQNAFSRNLLQAYVPTGELAALEKILGLFGGQVSYFLVYSWGRFWLNLILVLLVATLFWALLTSLRRYRPRFFKEGEVELGFLLVLLVGWPGFVIFLPLFLLMVVFISALRLLAWGERYTTLGWPMLISAGLTLIWSALWLTALGLNVLRI